MLFNSIAFALAMLVVGIGSALGQAQSSTFSTAGTTVWLCPAGVTSITVKCWGAGGGGGRGYTTIGAANGGGGGGACPSTTISVAPGQVFTSTIGAGGTGGSSGTDNGGTGGTTTFAWTSGGSNPLPANLTAGGGGDRNCGSRIDISNYEILIKLKNT
jgi:hypothetical protein